MGNQNFCDLAREKLSSNFTQSRFLLFSSFIFPSFLSLDNAQFPDFVQLIEWTQNAKPNGIDLKFLILSRDYKDSISHCLINDDCQKRILSMSHFLNSIHTQLLQIDASFFIQLNFSDFIRDKLSYVGIFESLLQIKSPKKIKKILY